MLTEKMQQALNKQVNAELYSAYMYLSMASYFESRSLKGFSSWMTVQAQEEVTHAMKIFTYMNERGNRVTMTAIDAPPTEWTSPLDVFEKTLEHEKKVTGLINNLVELAIASKDHATTQMLQWFVTEQVEEESSADAIVQKLKLIENSKGGLFMLDNELGSRVFTPPAQNE